MTDYLPESPKSRVELARKTLLGAIAFTSILAGYTILHEMRKEPDNNYAKSYEPPKTYIARDRNDANMDLASKKSLDSKVYR